MLAHPKTLSKWIHKHAPFPLGDPMPTIEVLTGVPPLDVRHRSRPHPIRAPVPTRCRRPTSQPGRPVARPQRKGYRPWRARSIVYLLVETGMRPAAAVNADLDEVAFTRARITVRENGGGQHTYTISREGLNAVREYVERARGGRGDPVVAGAFAPRGG